MTVLLARGSGSGESKSEEREGMHRHFEDLELEHCSRATFYCSRQVTRLSYLQSVQYMSLWDGLQITLQKAWM